MVAVIPIDTLWLGVEPVDMRAGADTLLARVVQVFGSAQAHHGYLFGNARSAPVSIRQIRAAHARRTGAW